jgi:hypothetical protein
MDTSLPRAATTTGLAPGSCLRNADFPTGHLLATVTVARPPAAAGGAVSRLEAPVTGG